MHILRFKNNLGLLAGGALLCLEVEFLKKFTVFKKDTVSIFFLILQPLLLLSIIADD